MGISKQVVCALGVAVCALGLAGQLHADDRSFAYSYEADSILPVGGLEFEQWATLRSGKDSGVYSRWDLRHELEVGLTDTFTAALYLNTVSKYASGVSGVSDRNGITFDGVAMEFKNMLASPHTNPVGVMLYFEPRFSGEELELEEKLILQHNFNSNWKSVLNLTLEQEWAYPSTGAESESSLKLSGGVAYQWSPTLSTGLEMLVDWDYDKIFESATRSAFFVGPNVHVSTGRLSLTAAILTQLTQEYESHEAVQVRVITGLTL